MDTIVEYDPRTTPWRLYAEDFPSIESRDHQLRFLVRYAILAPSSHNSQPWKFSIENSRLDLRADPDRRLRIADADNRELYITMGCALENLLIAADRFGLDYRIDLFPDPSDEHHIASLSIVSDQRIEPTGSHDLFDAVTARHTNHKPFDGRPISSDHLSRLAACAIGPDIMVYLSTDSSLKSSVDELMVHADALLFADPTYREELGYWIGQGVFGAPWLVAKLARLAVTYLDIGKRVARRDEEALMSSPVFGAILARGDGRETWVGVGRTFERVYLTAQALGVRLQPLSQLMEAAETRHALAGLLPEGWTPQQPFRLGYAEPELAHTPRRSLDEVIEER